MRFLALTFFAALLFSLPARADNPIPDGFTVADNCGPVRLQMAKGRWTSKTEFMIKFNELIKSLDEYWNGSVKTLKPRGHDSRFPEREIPKIDLVLFENEATRDDFLLKAGLADPHKAGAPQDTVYMALIDGKITKSGWEEVARKMSRVYAWHGLYFGPPTWLDRGMAEYFAFGNKAIKLAESAEYPAMIERLHEVQSRGAEKPLGETLLNTGDNWTQEDADNAWCLCHLLMTECKPLAIDLWTMLSAQQSCAKDRQDGVVSDSRKLLKFQLERAFGGAEKLQAAWDWHRDQMVKGGASIARLRHAPNSVRDATGFMVISFSAVVKSANSQQLFTEGWFAYSGPWPGPITVTASLSDNERDFAGETEIAGDRSDKSGAAAKWKDQKIPVPVSWTRAYMRATVTWEVDGGGIYTSSRVEKVSIPNR